VEGHLLRLVGSQRRLAALTNSPEWGRYAKSVQKVILLYGEGEFSLIGVVRLDTALCELIPLLTYV
jgi:hypothetical protein